MQSEKFERFAHALLGAALENRVGEELRRRLFMCAFDILDSIARDNRQALSMALGAVDNFLRAGRVIHQIHPVHARLLLAEGLLLKEEVARETSKDIVNIPVEELLATPFNERATPLPFGAKLDNSAKIGNNSATKSAIAEFNSANRQLDENAMPDLETIDSIDTVPVMPGIDAAQMINPSVRQSAIVDRIRQYGKNGLPLRDIIGIFGDMSERTLRYDLQKLCRDGILERIGQRGPGTFYRVREI